ncbi:MAG: divergent PAP2 family protein [Lentisphaerae bacterium]|nr:divergent PAP2 family protein [Lentisphaerota bacterium]
MHSIWTGWWFNPTFWAIFCGWMLAQVTKMVCFFVQARKIDFGFLASTGGMPSAHSSLAAALCTSVAIRLGTADPLFAVTLAFAAIVMFDAQSVRRAAGEQARVLNQMLDELFKTHRFPRQRLVELLGHTQIEVLLGMLMGIMVALLVQAVALTRGG